jgi:hypothetical protein
VARSLTGPPSDPVATKSMANGEKMAQYVARLAFGQTNV